MATIIDSLILELKLDPSGIVTGRKVAEDELKKTKKGFRKTGEEVNESGKRSVTFFKELRGQILGLLAAFTAGKGFKEFVTDLTNSDAVVKRMSLQLRMSAQDLAAWRGAAKTVGGTAEGLTASMQNLTGSLEQYLLTGSSPAADWLYQLGINIADSSGHLKTAAQLYLEIADAFDRLHVDPAKRAAILQGLGADQGTINLLAEGKEGVEKLLWAQKKLGLANEEDYKNALKRQKIWSELLTKWEDIGRKLLTNLEPILETIVQTLDDISDWAKKNPELVEAAFLGFSAAATALSVALSAGVLGALLKITGLITPVGRIVTLLLLAAEAFQALGGFEGIGKLWADMWKPAVAPPNRKQDLRPGAAMETQKTRPTPQDTVKPEVKIEPVSPAETKKTKTRFKLPVGPTQVEDDIKYFVSKGWTRPQAIGIVANFQRESSLHQDAENGTHYGLGQWDPTRQEDFKKLFNHDIRSSSREEQLAFTDYELREGKEQAAGKALFETTTEADAAKVVSKKYERPDHGELEAVVRASIAVALEQQNLTETNSTTSTITTSVGQVTIVTQAKDAEGVSREIKAALERNSIASQANMGAR